jgi:hypothetical protein
MYMKGARLERKPWDSKHWHWRPSREANNWSETSTANLGELYYRELYYRALWSS